MILEALGASGINVQMNNKLKTLALPWSKSVGGQGGQKMQAAEIIKRENELKEQSWAREQRV